jgi:menaquinone-9 beta-reductase
MTSPLPKTRSMAPNFDRIDVTVVGGGLAGMAASIHLARAGLQVLCIEAEDRDSNPVGESLDWSAPELLRALGLPMDYLLREEIATWKRHVILKIRGGAERHYVPSEWLGKPPYNVELRTIHVDRTRLNQAVRKIVLKGGVTLVCDKAVSVERDGNRAVAVQTESGSRVSSPWFIDASGSATSLFPRVFGLPIQEYGPKKVAIWDYFVAPESLEGTTLLADGEGPPYMEWMWQIPIHPKTVSVGYVTTGDIIKQKRQAGETIEEIYFDQLARYEDLSSLQPAPGSPFPRTTSFRCRAYHKIAGPNWFVAGESGAMVDPMTSNGVTAALRHAEEASTLIARYRKRRQVPWLARTLYARRVIDLANFFNECIEKVIYDWPIRNRIGALTAGDVYTIPAWSINHLYSRFRPRGLFGTMLFGLLLWSIRSSLAVYYWFCKRSRSASPQCAVGMD